MNVPEAVQQAMPEMARQIAPLGVLSFPKVWLYVEGLCGGLLVAALVAAFVAGRRSRR